MLLDNFIKLLDSFTNMKEIICLQNNQEIIEYYKKHKKPDFFKYFYRLKVNKSDIKEYQQYCNAIICKNNGLSPNKIYKLLHISKRKVENWFYENNKPIVIHILNYYSELGTPRNKTKWLSLNSTRGGLLTGPWIKVPSKIVSFAQLVEVIGQTQIHKKNDGDLVKDYSIENRFAYLLGFAVGDSSKTGIVRKNKIIRRIQIRLSKGYETNERIGDFVTFCINSLGLRMKKTKDCPAGKCNTNSFYSWMSQSSSFFSWIYNVCLGLKDNELTTYDKIHANWIIKAPVAFRISFLQGLADSDGFVDFSSKQVGIITEPNTDFITKILNSLRINSHKRFFTNNRLWSVMIDYNSAYILPLFNPIIKSYRYKYVEKLYFSTNISGHWPEWLRNEVIKELNKGNRGTQIVKNILENYNIRIGMEGIRRLNLKNEENSLFRH